MKSIKRHPKKLRKIYNENYAEVVQTLFKEFCANSAVHGVRYFAERERHWTERVWWLIAFGVSVFLCGSAITNIWMEWQGHPVAFNSENPMPISAIPFPTVTICPQYKSDAKQANINSLLHLIDDLDRVSDNEKSKLETISHVCRIRYPGNFVIGHKFTDESIYKTIRNISLLTHRVINYSVWETDYDIRFVEFTSRFTDEGLCFTFNDLNSMEIYTNEMTKRMMTVKRNPNISGWTMENGYDHNATLKSYPLRVFNARPTSALAIQLGIGSENYNNYCPRGTPGFKIFVSTPGEVPLVFRRFIHIPMEEEVKMLIKATLTTTSDGLRGYHPDRRQCFFQAERRLHFFKLYTQNNCEAECLANFTLQECGCVHFSMPRDSSTKICGMELIECYQKAEKQIFGEDVIDGLTDEAAKKFRRKCNCLPSCTSIKYNLRVDRVSSASKFNDSKLTNVRFFFTDHQVTTLKRSETLAMPAFISSCGGLLGLFLGISVLSVIELIYYATLRLFWSVRKQKSQNIVVPFRHKAIKSIPISINPTNKRDKNVKH